MRSVPAALFLIVAAHGARAEDAEALRKSVVEARAGLARDAGKDGLVEEAIREWQNVLRDDPGNAEATKALAAAPFPGILEWPEPLHRKYLAWNTRRLKTLRELATRAAAIAAERDAAGDHDGCWEACQRAFACDPDCDKAHSLLGEAKYDGAWVTAEIATKRGKGLLELRGEWLPAEDVRKKRGEWANAWEIEGAHFSVRSNRGLGPARSVLARAEEVNAAFLRDVMGVVDAAPFPKKLVVLDFASLDDLDAHIKADHGTGTAPKGVPGFYTPGEAVHLTVLPDGSMLTRDDIVRHECTHAAAGHAIPLQGWINSRPHFWVWEGLASYFESADTRDGKIVAGDPNYVRFALAREELEAGKFTPLAKFVQLDQDGLGKQYQQAAGLVHFFLHEGRGKYREKFLAYFKAVATGLAEKDAFEKAFGAAPETFEEEWKAHVKTFGKVPKPGDK